MTFIKAASEGLTHTAIMQSRLLVLLISGITGLFSPHGFAADRVYEVTGVIRQALDASQRIRIAHDDIPGVMPAMTMAFQVTPATDAVGLKPGDRVRFKLHANESNWFVSSFALVGAEASAVPSAAAGPANRRLREGDRVPEFSLVNQDDSAFTSAALRGKAMVLTFVFTRCPVPEYCPAMALRFGQLQKAILVDPRLAANVGLLSITLDPEFDRPAILKAYGEAVGANPAVWQFATGTKAEIGALTKAFAVYTERNGVTLDHTLCTALIAPDGRVLQLWRGNGWKTDEILAALKDSVGH